MKAHDIFHGSDGHKTREFYIDLESAGPIGIVAMNLFRANKCSARAKVYRGGIKGKGSYRQLAYDRKNWSLNNLCEALVKHGESLQIKFGWKKDHATVGFEWVLYVDLPTGQVSFHSATRMQGPDYPGEWCKEKLSDKRIIAFADQVFASVKRTSLFPEDFAATLAAKRQKETLDLAQTGPAPWE